VSPQVRADGASVVGKRMRFGSAEEREAASRLLTAQLSALRRLRHPNVLQLHGARIEPGPGIGAHGSRDGLQWRHV
jgi:hypothetical protein